LITRYTLDGLPPPEAPVRIMHQRLRDVPVHWHDFYELVLVLDGASRHVCNGSSREIGPWSALLLSPADFHGYSGLGDEPLSCYNVVIDPWLVDPHLEGLLGPGASRSGWTVDDFVAARPDVDRLWQEHGGDRPGAGQMVDALLRCVLVEFARQVARESVPGDVARAVAAPDDQLRHALFFVDQHFRQPLTLQDVAAQAHLSANYFSERFHDYTGVSFQAYLLHRRLRFARSLLAATDVSITEACHAAGFNNVSHIGRAYRARYGHPPSATRGAAAPGLTGPRS
jgi:AraC-like DNA-binding protein